MALVLRTIYKYYNEFLDISDKRTENYFLAGSPLPMLIIITLYWLFVRKWGPKTMEHRKPYNVDRIVQIYNLSQVVANGFLTYEILHSMVRKGWSFRCESVDWMSPVGLEQANLVYMYYIIKITDLLDTIFFILRKKNNQATFLHVYHHFIMVFLSFVVLKIVPGGHILVIGLLNCFIHVVMYFYYFLTSFKPELKQSMWWKKYITQLQMTQFGFLMVHFLRAMFYNGCEFPKPVSYLCFLQAVTFFLLFLNFYRRAYLKKKKFVK